MDSNSEKYKQEAKAFTDAFSGILIPIVPAFALLR
jgi:hypothetical protein